MHYPNMFQLFYRFNKIFIKKINQFIKKKLIIVFIIALVFVLIANFAVTAQNTTIPNSHNKLFYQTSDFWLKVTITILSTSSGALFGYLSSAKKSRDEAVEISYTKQVGKILEFLEFNKDIRQKINIFYSSTDEVEDLYLLSCDLENTGKKVIKNENIIFEISPVGVGGILDSFFDPPLEDNPMGVDEVPLSNLQSNEVKKQYKIREILPGNKLGFRFLTATDKANKEKIPNLFISQTENSKVQLNPKAYSRERIDNKTQLVRFFTLFLMYFLIPPLFYIIPFGLVNNIPVNLVAVNLARLAILILIFPNIGLFSKTIADLFITLTHGKKVDSYANRTININGNYNERIEGNYTQGSYYTNYLEGHKNLIRVAEEIKKILEQLDKTYPADTTKDKMTIAFETIQIIENNPALQEQIINMLRTNNFQDLAQWLNHSAASFVIAALEDWQKQKES